MLRKDKVLTGIVTGILFPIIIFVIVWEINSMLVENKIMPNEGFRLQFLVLISIISNVIPAGSYLSAKKDRALFGVGGVTLLFAFSFLIYFYKGIFGS